MLAICIHVSSIVILPWLYFFLWTLPPLWPVLIYYTLFRYWLDKSPSTGESINRKSDWFRRLWWFRYFCRYFPIHVHKMADLQPTFETKNVQELYLPAPWSWMPQWLQNSLIASKRVAVRERTVAKKVRTGPRYVFGCHPHGVIALGITGALAGEGCEISKVLPGIEVFLLTLVNQFWLPFYRDYIMALGVGLVTRKGIQSLLSHDKSVAIVVGGAAESLLAKPGMNSLILNRRKGFVRMALKMAGVSSLSETHDDGKDMSLVPIYSFGENNIYNVYYTKDSDDGSNEAQSKTSRGWKRILRVFQARLKKNWGFTLPVVQSRGIFNYDFGLLPYRRPIDIVFGEPIPIKRLYGAKPGDPVTDKEVDHYHVLYVAAVRKLFAENKDKYLNKWDQDLQIIE